MGSLSADLHRRKTTGILPQHNSSGVLIKRKSLKILGLFSVHARSQPVAPLRSFSRGEQIPFAGVAMSTE